MLILTTVAIRGGKNLAMATEIRILPGITANTAATTNTEYQTVTEHRHHTCSRIVTMT